MTEIHNMTIYTPGKEIIIEFVVVLKSVKYLLENPRTPKPLKYFYLVSFNCLKCDHETTDAEELKIHMMVS